MSIIVGVESTVKPYVSVIAADTLGVNGIIDILIPSFIDSITDGEQIQTFSLEYLKKGIPTSISHKIETDKSKRKILARVGDSSDESSKAIRGFLLEGPEYLRRNLSLATDCYNIDPLVSIMSDFFVKTNDLQRIMGLTQPKELIDRLVEAYLKSYSLEERLMNDYIPELPRITAVMNRSHLQYGCATNADNTFFSQPRWGGSGAYLLSAIIEEGNTQKPRVFPIRHWGVCRRTKPFSALGSGAPYALGYLYKELGIDPEEPGSEFKEFRINRERAIRLATGAVKESNKKHPYSSGLDYAILTTDGVETHFSTEEKSEPIRLSPEGIKLEIEMLKSYMGKLETVRMLLLEENQK